MRSSSRLLGLFSATFCVLMGCGDSSEASPPDAGSPDAGPDAGSFVFPPRVEGSFEHPLDDVLRMNHIQMKGTHNSYHLRSPTGASFWDYEHAPLDVQFGEQGVRAIELDVYWNATAERFEVYHVPSVDAETTCLLLVDCLATIRLWSDAHPGHHPIFVQIEPKGDLANAGSVGRVAELDDVILSILPREIIITPEDVQGPAATLREAVTENGWPTLGDSRGKVLFFLDCGRDLCLAYANDGDSLDGRLIFAASQANDPFEAVRVMNNPGSSQIPDVVEAGFIVRTRALSVEDEDDSTAEPALASGSHIISTDYPAEVPERDYWLEIPDGTPSRCNPISAPEACTSNAIEDPDRLSDPVP